MMTRKQKIVFDLLVKKYRSLTNATNQYTKTPYRLLMNTLINRPRLFLNCIMVDVEKYHLNDFTEFENNLVVINLKNESPTISLYKNGEEITKINDTLFMQIFETIYYLVVLDDEITSNQDFIDYTQEDFTCTETQAYTDGFVNYLELLNEATILQDRIDTLLEEPLTAATKAEILVHNARLLEIQELNTVNTKTYIH